ncbi:MAG: hypothetical protein KKH01_03665 [Firmicutes bacterium]|nr:hypothetical protein [Bacillota bacterium]
MKTYNLLKQKIIINNQRSLMDQNDNLVYQFKSNFFQTRFKVFQFENNLVSIVSQKFRFRRQYIITMKDGLTIKVKSNKLFFHRLKDSVAIDDMKRFSIHGDIDKMIFTISDHEEAMLIVEPFEQGNIFRKITVKDETFEPILISLLFTIIIVFDHTYANN